MVFGNNTASDISKFSKIRKASGIWEILKYYKTVLLPNQELVPNTMHKSCYYLFIIEAEKFSVTHKRPFFRYGSKKQTQTPAFVTIFLRPNIQSRLSSLDFVFVHCFVREHLYLLFGHFR